MSVHSFAVEDFIGEEAASTTIRSRSREIICSKQNCFNNLMLEDPLNKHWMSGVCFSILITVIKIITELFQTFLTIILS